MRSTVSGLAVVLALAGCHWNRPAKDAEAIEDTESSSESSGSSKSSDSTGTEALPQSGALDKAVDKPNEARAEKATILDDTDKKDVACAGMAIADLIASLSQASCELPANAPPQQKQMTKDVLEVTATPESAQIAPGATAQIRVVFKNKTKAKLPLDFTIDPDPRFTFELYTFKGSRADKPPGNEPAIPSEASENAASESHTARVTLFPNGTATVVLPWQAVKYKWASKERAKGALPGRGYPRDPAGPLAKGKYVLRVVTPLVNVDESNDKEISQPRAHFEIAGSVAPPPPPPAPPAAAADATKKGTGTPASSNESVEAKFLKATGGQAPPADKPGKADSNKKK